jgi:uncharacterized protein (DUF2141 family)
MNLPPLPSLLAVLLCAVAAVGAPIGSPAAAELRVTVTGLSSARGDVHFAVYAKPEHFPGREGRVAKGATEATAEGASMIFPGLAPGTYAVAVYHDENRNNEFDQAIFGIPLEDYGFSNGATVFFGPPDFAEAAFTLNAGGTAITIRLND